MSPKPVFLFISVALAAAAAGCSSTTPGAAAVTATAPDSDSCARAIRFVVQQDKSGSGNSMRTPQILADLEPIVAFVIRCGGEVAVGLIAESSNSSLVRLYVPQPPTRPNEPSRTGTPFEIGKALENYNLNMAQYDSAIAKHFADAQQRAAAFREQAGHVLATRNDAKRTDIWGALSRCAYFLSEPVKWKGQPRMAAIVVSDAIDNVGALNVPMPPDAELFLVNGAPSLGSLESLKPTRFESFEAAVRYLLGD